MADRVDRATLQPCARQAAESGPWRWLTLYVRSRRPTSAGRLMSTPGSKTQASVWSRAAASQRAVASRARSIAAVRVSTRRIAASSPLARRISAAAQPATGHSSRSLRCDRAAERRISTFRALCVRLSPRSHAGLAAEYLSVQSSSPVPIDRPNVKPDRGVTRHVDLHRSTLPSTEEPVAHSALTIHVWPRVHGA